MPVLPLNTFVCVSVVVTGEHYYPNAPQLVNFLKYPHTHNFKISVVVEETSDRQVEFYILKGKILKLLTQLYKRDKLGKFLFGQSSCETISKELGKAFIKTEKKLKIIKVSVFEDDAFGAEVTFGNIK